MTRYYYTKEGTEVHGPVELESIRQMVGSAILPVTAQVCAEGTDTWMAVGDITHPPDPIPPPVSRPSFGSRLASMGKAAIQGTKRNAHLAALKGRIEKLRLVDMHKAQYALGRKAYELRVAEDKIGAEYEEIAAIEKTIAAKRVGVPGDHSATNMELVKGFAIGVKMRAEAEGLELRLKQMFVALGSGVEGLSEAVGLESEMAGVKAVRTQIDELEKEYSTASADRAARGE
jgi:hypothetical protein